jgi:glutathione peroxidase
MTIYDTPINTLAGEPSSLEQFKGNTILIVNVASKCGLTPQYEGLENLQKRFGAQNFSVVGFPCNQFAEQEPGSADEIQTFCSTTYGVTFPLFEKIEGQRSRSESDLRGTRKSVRRRRLQRRRALEL